MSRLQNNYPLGPWSHRMGTKSQSIYDIGPYWDEWLETVNNARHTILAQKCATYYSLSNCANSMSLGALVPKLSSNPYCHVKRFGMEKSVVKATLLLRWLSKLFSQLRKYFLFL
ncbi:hypothetical protein NPIL_25201 [Nephila pilipes]|uniref:Uncharacterized protein n=1 Tax=Nephila pilipes TaxID=299642 RepID=A0A8X6UKV5_NEPPI|nr:hypothetical protein NPIL_107681 [Nephila pilipes]GFU20437.1 hypothetical protein NPIL_25201 [Nephila pilipes]